MIILAMIMGTYVIVIITSNWVLKNVPSLSFITTFITFSFKIYTKMSVYNTIIDYQVETKILIHSALNHTVFIKLALRLKSTGLQRKEVVLALQKD